ncbi:MAG: glycosyltransferase family 2 protein [Bacteroidota bacterium]
MAVSLILPCYNPPAGWARAVLSSYTRFCTGLSHKVELIIVMDGVSRSVTEEAIDFLKKSIPGLVLITYQENRGKGYAIRKGVAQATGDILIYTDIDFPYAPESLLAIYNALNRNECDVAAGVKDETYYSHVPPLRRAISRNLQSLIKVFLSMPVTDTQCGLKGFRSNVKPLFLKTTIKRYLFDLEFIRNCFKSKQYRVKAVPVKLNDNVQFRSMNYRILLPEMANFIKLLFK